MNFTKEMIEKAKTAKSGTEILELSKTYNIEMTETEANGYFAELHKSGELADEELDNVVGGCGSSEEKPATHKYNAKDKILFKRTPASEYEFGVIQRFLKYEGDKEIYVVFLTDKEFVIHGQIEGFYISEDLIHRI